MRERLKLKPGEQLKHERSRSKGTMAETDIDTYLVVNKSGEIVGSVVHEDHTAIRGFNRTQTLIQKDAKGNIIVDEQWNGD